MPEHRNEKKELCGTAHEFLQMVLSRRLRLWPVSPSLPNISQTWLYEGLGLQGHGNLKRGDEGACRRELRLIYLHTLRSEQPK